MTDRPTEEYLLHIQDVYKQYGSKVILDNIDLSVRKGELVTVVGPSGCGKSTLLRLILGQERCTSGTILIDGEPVGFANTDRGIVYQRYSLFPHLTVLGNVLLGRQLTVGFLERRRRRKEFCEEALFYLEKMRLHQHAHKYPHELSGGMQQRVAIAQALIVHPKILLMDEPFGALDPETREDAQLFLLELWEQSNMTIFFVTHDLEEALYLGTRVFVLSQFYIDDRGQHSADKGAKIVADYQLPRSASSTEVKHTPEFTQLIAQIRSEGFDPKTLQHAKDFNYSHPDSWQTLTDDEHRGE